MGTVKKWLSGMDLTTKWQFTTDSVQFVDEQLIGSVTIKIIKYNHRAEQKAIINSIK